MKLRTKRGEVKVLVTDPATGETRGVQLTDDLTPRQITKMSARPDMILQYVHFPARQARGERRARAGHQGRGAHVAQSRPVPARDRPGSEPRGGAERLISHAPWLVQLDESAVPGSLPRSARNGVPAD